MDHICRYLWCALAAAALSGCASQTVSGAYIALDGQYSVDLLQLTQSKDGALLGTLDDISVRPDGSVDRSSLGVSGTTDGHSITLTMKPSELLGTLLVGPISASGSVNDGVITLTLPQGTERFVKSSVSAYRADTQKLIVEAAAVRSQVAKAKRNEEAAAAAQIAKNAHDAQIDELNSEAGRLANQLNAYVTKVETQQNDIQHRIQQLHEIHKQALQRIRHGWEIEQRYRKGSLQASQAYLAMNQVALNLNTYDINWDLLVETTHQHIRSFDADVAHNVCDQKHADKLLNNCTSSVPRAITAYGRARRMVLGDIEEVSSLLRTDKAMATSILSKAQDYSQ